MIWQLLVCSVSIVTFISYLFDVYENQIFNDCLEWMKRIPDWL